MDAEVVQPKLYPAWKQAERDLLAGGLTYGSLITDEWLESTFGLEAPKTIAEFERNQLMRLNQQQQLFDSLLENHRMMVERVKGVGYTVLPPERQTSVAMDRRGREVKSALSKMAREISFVNTAMLTDSQRKENSDAQAQMGALRALMRKHIT